MCISFGKILTICQFNEFNEPTRRMVLCILHCGEDHDSNKYGLEIKVGNEVGWSSFFSKIFYLLMSFTWIS